MLSRPNNTPLGPGVYVFKTRGKPIYIGKAANLKKRVFSYWKKNSGDKATALVREANSIEFIETTSEIEALIKEAELIKSHLPKYNILMRDDKNYFYVGITKEDFPKIFVTHQPFAQSVIARSPAEGGTTRQSGRDPSYPLRMTQWVRSPRFARDDKNTNFIGPFTSGGALKTTLRFLRGIFPYCTCSKIHKRPCLNSQIGRCLGFCCAIPFVIASDSEAIPKRSFAFAQDDNTDKIATASPRNDGKEDARNDKIIEYQQNIKSIVAILKGKKRSLLASLKKQMRQAVKKENYESAAKLRDQIFGLDNIFQHRVILRESRWKRDDRRISIDPSLPLRMTKREEMTNRKWPKTEKELQKIFETKNSISRVEGYDISNISGKEATGSMVVFKNGFPEKSSYRKFQIKTVKGINDIDMLKEVLLRRLKHIEWTLQDLMVIDGGRTQLNAALSIIQKISANIKIVSLAKQQEELYLPGKSYTIPIKKLSLGTNLFFQFLRNEAHRFAKRYHHKLREIAFKK